MMHGQENIKFCSMSYFSWLVGWFVCLLFT